MYSHIGDLRPNMTISAEIQTALTTLLTANPDFAVSVSVQIAGEDAFVVSSWRDGATDGFAAVDSELAPSLIQSLFCVSITGKNTNDLIGAKATYDDVTRRIVRVESLPGNSVWRLYCEAEERAT
jgi:hypothetical protein